MDVCFSKIDDFWKNLIQHTVCSFYQNKIAPTFSVSLKKFQRTCMFNKNCISVPESTHSESDQGKTKTKRPKYNSTYSQLI